MSLVRFVRNALKSGRRFPWTFYTVTDAKPPGHLIGTDHFGNRYYEDTDTEIWARQRWVESPSSNFDPSQVPAEWHSWLHRISDKRTAPTHETMMNRWLMKHTPNYTGTARAYRPYNTTAPKIQSWEPEVTPRD
ncbi:NDUFA12-domain-containing protein [Syncephalis plumigaleata]|nr:NDUFA12-domain-containing protein [Syncephalis plumigaleata]